MNRKQRYGICESFVKRSRISSVTDPIELTGIQDEQAVAQALEAEQDQTGLWHLRNCQTIVSYLFGDFEQAKLRVGQAYSHAAGGVGMPTVPILCWYEALTNLAILATPGANLSQTEYAEYWQAIETAQAKLQGWASHAPMNCQHRYDLICAETYKLREDWPAAILAYESAIAGAKANGYVQEEALANELAAKFYLTWDKEKIAAGYLQEAYYCYARWGAKAKAADLEQCYPQLLQPILQATNQPLTILETLATISAPTYSLHSTSSKSSSSSSINQTLDFSTLLQMSQTFASTIALDELLQTLALTLLQNSGADQCALLLCENNQWQVRVMANLEQVMLQSVPLEDNPTVPVQLIHYVKHSLTTVVIDDLKTDLPVISDYLYHHQPKSVLCLPILNQGNLRAILYLENRSTSGVFTSDRVFILNFLCTQASISLENARLYAAEREKAEQLAQLNHKLSLTQFSVDCAANGIFWMHPDARFFYVNQTACETLEYSPEELMALSVTDIDPNVSAEFWAAHRQEVREKTSLTFESSHQSKSGRIYPVEISVNYLEFAGQEYYVAIVRDISERKQAEMSILEKTQALEQAVLDLQGAQLQVVQSEKMASLGNLVAGVAHEINNPIGFLNGSINNGKDYVEDLLGHLALYQQHYPNPVSPIQDHAEDIDLEFLSEDLPKLLDSMQGATERIRGISTSLRTFSRADTEHKVSANLHDGLDSTILILKYRLKANEHRPAIEVIQDYGNLPLLDCFPGQLNQVFMNILANAIDMFDEMAQTRSFAELAAHPQKITIRTSVDADQVQIQICDNGKGMPEEVKTKIFDHLFTTKGVGKGTGLGLAIARQIVVDKHSGSLTVQSEPGKGTEFCIRLPIVG
ncbi:ATP-binding protein [Leptolyngbya boryana CZ1]|uniref:histidine kinase n=1 Tax=Leptolyngbya boryana CZ1 TaxID=3060204 RepID=A0AA96X0Q1_LEPBY|nr:ATP-binding protein [Leptolyngbya boryana]WNZ48681.1 ATP-binding protein [Leptolyngbya boryana CZ1]